jgi:hypothetical protein
VLILSLEMYIHPHRVNLRPTDEVGEDGWQFIFIGPDLETSKVAQSEEFILETIASVIPEEITFRKIAWASEFRCVCVPSIAVDMRSSRAAFRANIRMVDKFNDRRVFVAGGM